MEGQLNQKKRQRVKLRGLRLKKKKKKCEATPEEKKMAVKRQRFLGNTESRVSKQQW